MALLFFCSLASEEEHDDDDDEDDDNDEEEEGGRGVGSDGCSPWGLIDDVGGRGTSASGGPSMSPVDYQVNNVKGILTGSVCLFLFSICYCCAQVAHLAVTLATAQMDSSSSSQQHPTGSQT